MENFDIYNVEFNNWEKNDNFYFKSKEKAKEKFDEIIKKYELTVKWNFARDDFWNSARIGKIAFED